MGGSNPLVYDGINCTLLIWESITFVCDGVKYNLLEHSYCFHKLYVSKSIILVYDGVKHNVPDQLSLQVPPGFI